MAIFREEVDRVESMLHGKTTLKSDDLFFQAAFLCMAAILEYVIKEDSLRGRSPDRAPTVDNKSL